VWLIKRTYDKLDLAEMNPLFSFAAQMVLIDKENTCRSDQNFSLHVDS